MKIRWRQHELMLAGFITLFYILGIFSRDVNLSPNLLHDIYELPFRERQFPFSYFQNVLLPDILLGMSAFLAFFYLNQYIITRLIIKGRYVWGIFHIGFLFLAFGSVIAFANYLLEQHLYYSPTHANRSILRVWAEGIFFGGRILLMYGVYVFIREAIIHYLKRDNNRKAFRIMITNRITAVSAIYFSIFAFAVFFQLFHVRLYYIGYLFFVPPIIISFFTGLYWFFPFKGTKSFLRMEILLRFIVSMLATSIPFGILFGSTDSQPPQFFPYLMVCSILQLLAYSFAWLMYIQQKEKIDLLRGLETELGKSTAGLQFLRSQINPHFLFNALNTIYGMALQEKAERTAEGVQQLGDMMRFMLHENAKDMIAVESEIEYLKNYISLQKLRTQSSPDIKIETDILPFPGKHQIAPMLLIPFVENAFKHGISLERPSFIKIVLRQKEDTLYFDVHNSIHHSIGQDTEQFKSGIGLQNVQQRLDLLYPGSHELIIHESASEFFIHLTIQLT